MYWTYTLIWRNYHIRMDIGMLISGSSITETSVRSPWKSFIFIVFKMFSGSKYPTKVTFNFENRTTAPRRRRTPPELLSLMLALLKKVWMPARKSQLNNLRRRKVLYCIAAKYSNKSVFQHWFKEGCRKRLWKDVMPQRAHDQGGSIATFGWRIWYHLAKLHVYEVRKVFEYLEVMRYIVIYMFAYV